MSRQWSRREVVSTGVAGAAALAAGLGSGESAGKLPTRVLGKTGVQVPVLGFGTAPTGLKRNLKEAIAVYNKAIDAGVTYMDTAPKYGGYGDAQVQLGHVLKERRKEVFLVTKLWEPEMDQALRLLESNLKELQTDHVDLLYAHSLGSDKMDPAKVTGPRGTMAALQRARERGLARFIGVTGHNRPGRFLKILEDFDIDVMMNAVNLADRYTYGFEEQVWPAAAKKRVGLVAMKVFGGMGKGPELSSRMMPEEHLRLAFRYALHLPNVSTVVVGMTTGAELERNIAFATDAAPWTAADQAEAGRVGRTLAAKWGPHFGVVV